MRSASSAACTSPPTARPRGGRGFTLIELLVVVLILLLLATVTVSAINLSIDGDKVRAGARQVQSYLEGARDRAIYAKQPRGVRFILDPTPDPADPTGTNLRTVSSMVYIVPTEDWDRGAIVLERLDGDNDGDPANNDMGDPLASVGYLGIDSTNNDQAWVIRGFDGADPNDSYTQNRHLNPTNWKELYDRGVLRDGARIQIPAVNGTYYTVSTILLKNYSPYTSGNYYPPRLLLTQPYRAQPTAATNSVEAFSAGTGAWGYRLQLAPGQMPNQEPVQLPKGVVIHLDRCSSNPDNLSVRGDRLPPNWKLYYASLDPSLVPPPAQWDPSSYVYNFPTYPPVSPTLDIMFSPRGAVTGTSASSGLIQLYVGEQKDADQDRIDWNAGNASAHEFVTRPADNYTRGDKLIVSIFTRTGQVAVNPLHPYDEDINGNGVLDAGEDANGNGVRDRTPFRYSITGEVAGK